MKRSITLLFALIFLLSACGPKATPTPDPVNVQETAMAMALQISAQTQAAMPTATQVPTATPVPPTATSLPPTPDLLVASPTLDPFALPAIQPTNTYAAAASNGNSCNQPLTSWAGPSAKINLYNYVKNSNAIVSLYVQTELGECGYISRSFPKSTTVDVPVGCYTAWAMVDGKKDFQASTNFCITTGSWSLNVEENRLTLRGGCAPNC